MNANAKALAEALRRWYEAPSAQVIDLQKERERRSQNWLLKHARTVKPQPPRVS